MNPIQFLTSIDKASGEAFAELRKAAMNSGPLDERTCELIVTSSFAAAGQEDSFKIHAKRLLALGTTVAEIRQAVLVTLGATTIFSQVVTALKWIDEVGAS